MQLTMSKLSDDQGFGSDDSFKTGLLVWCLQEIDALLPLPAKGI